MSTLTLLHPVHTLDNQLLLPAGSVVSTETLDDLISSSKATSSQSCSLLRYGLVKEDLLHFLSSSFYQVIFNDQKQVADLLNIMETVHAIPSFLQSLDYFKQYDLYTYRHILLVFALSTLLAKDLISDYHEHNLEHAAGVTHDLGKICVPLHILKKSDPLTRAERSALKYHAAAGFVLICYYLQDTQHPAAIVARDHHERRDGSGYPRGIQLTNLMVEIIAVTDIHDALISSRPYRPVSYDNRTALEEITRMAEKNKIGWDLVKVLITHNRRNKPHYNEVTVSMEKRGTSPLDNVYGITREENNHSPG